MSVERTLKLPGIQGVGPTWLAVAHATRDWLAQRGIPARDAVVLVPFAQLIEPARAALATAGGWPPRVETTTTLAAALAPPPEPAGGGPVGVVTLDRLLLAQRLRRQPALAEAAKADPRGWAQAVAATVDQVHELIAAAAAQPPAARPGWWRAVQGSHAGLSGLRGGLLRSAVAWASGASAPRSDILFETKVGAWIVVRAGGPDALAEALAATHPAPALLIDLDPDPDRPFAGAADSQGGAMPAWLQCNDFELEARAAAAAVADAVSAGAAPVALITLDRLLTRRIRALLERRGIGIADETGWTLSTTRAAALLMALLRAAAPGAGRDDWLDWLGARADAPSLRGRLERAWRSDRAPDAAAAAWFDAARQQLAGFGIGQRHLADWLASLATVLEASGLGERLQADAAGAEVLRALSLDNPPPAAGPWAEETLDFSGFTAWIEATLETGRFIATAAPGATVVFTPLARALMRPFGAIVVPGADENQLGAWRTDPGGIDRRAAESLGLRSPEPELAAERAAFLHLLRCPRLVLLHRLAEGDEAIGPSPFIVGFQQARRHGGAPAWQPHRIGAADLSRRRVGPAPVSRPAPSAAGRLPAELSATTIEQLRQCPYRFFARAVLGLGDPDELEREASRRDQGNWLHDALERFHRARGGHPGADEAALLDDAAAQALAALSIEPHRMLPYRAAFEALAPAYLEWLRAHEAAGWRWHEGELKQTRDEPSLGGTLLAGRIDRIDLRAPQADAPETTMVIDYKSGGRKKFSDTIKRNRFEDTQLAFYGALLRADDLAAGEVAASYLLLDRPDEALEVAHPSVGDSARALIDGLAIDLQRLRQGHGLPALGEGTACEYCEARGLCRRDHWSAAPGADGP